MGSFSSFGCGLLRLAGLCGLFELSVAFNAAEGRTEVGHDAYQTDVVCLYTSLVCPRIEVTMCTRHTVNIQCGRRTVTMQSPYSHHTVYTPYSHHTVAIQSHHTVVLQCGSELLHCQPYTSGTVVSLVVRMEN